MGNPFPWMSFQPSTSVSECYKSNQVPLQQDKQSQPVHGGKKPNLTVTALEVKHHVSLMYSMNTDLSISYVLIKCKMPVWPKENFYLCSPGLAAKGLRV